MASRRPRFGVTLHVRTTQKSFVDGSYPEPWIHTKITARRGRKILPLQVRVRAGYFRLTSTGTCMGGLRAWTLPPSPFSVDLRRMPHSHLFCGPSHLWEGKIRPPGRHTQERDGARGRHAGTGKRACKSGSGVRSPRGIAHDEGPRHLGTSQGCLSWREVNTTVPVLLTENKNDRQESAGPPTCTATKRIWGKRAWGPKWASKLALYCVVAVERLCWAV